MAKRYRPVDRDQPFLLPPDMRDWLPGSHPVWLVIRVAGEHLDTSAFHALRRTGGAGTAGYDPDMLLTVLVWAYAHGVTSSRRMEQLCGTDVAFKVICGGNLPDHVTLARFRAGFPGAIAAFFAEVLALCARLGMGKLGVVALDGTKIRAHASKSANRTEGTLRKMAEETVARHARDDAAEDAMFGGAAGDEVPGDAWSPRSRDSRIAAALASLEAERAAAEAERQRLASEHVEAARAGKPRTGNRPAEADVEVAELNLARAAAAQDAKVADFERRNAGKMAATGTGLAERPPVPASAHAKVQRAAARLEKARQRAAERDRGVAGKEKNRKGPGPVRNVTDPDSRLMPVRGGGFIQGYNAQNVTSADGLIIATRLTQDTGDMAWYEPMLRAAEQAAARITALHPPAGAGEQGVGPATAQPAAGDAQDGGAALIGLFLADAGYLSEQNLTCAGPDRLIATGKHRDLEKAARAAEPAGGDADGAPDGTGTAISAMAARLATPDGITAYRQRGHIAETPHGNIKHNMNLGQLSLRGLAKAAAEWDLACSAHNLFKAITSGHLTSAALDRLASQAGCPPSPRAVPA